MTRERGDGLAKVLTVAMVMSAMLFLLASASLCATIRFRNGMYEDGRVVEARVLKIHRGKGAEVQVEYTANGDRYQEWVSCGNASCPKVGELFKVEYSAEDPGQVTRNRAGPFSRIALVGLFGTAIATPIFAILLRRELRKIIRAWNSARAGQSSHVAHRDPRHEDESRFRNGQG